MLDLQKYVDKALAGELVNDAERYGVKVASIPSSRYQVRIVHHLTGEENANLANAFVMLIDGAGKRVCGCSLGYDWEGRDESQPIGAVSLEKPDGEPHGNLSLHAGEKDILWVIGDGTSDIITGLCPDFVSDGPGNEWGHHSFLIIFEDVDVPGSTTDSQDVLASLADQLAIVNDSLERLVKALQELADAT